MESSIKIIATADGLPTLYREDIDEQYHSVRGALTESRHVYAAMGLLEFLQRSGRREATVLEVGFGTGLNFMTALEVLPEGVILNYIGLEKNPLSKEITEMCGYASIFPLYERVGCARWGVSEEVASGVWLRKEECDFLSVDLPRGVDVVFFDAFAPEKQPEMWSSEAFERLYDCMSAGGVITTYCAKGVIRRMMQAAGFVIERLAGPAGGKREMLRGIKPEAGRDRR